MELRDEWIKYYFLSCLVSQVVEFPETNLKTVIAAVDCDSILSSEHSYTLLEYSIGRFFVNVSESVKVTVTYMFIL